MHLRKLDKLVLRSFIAPLILTLFVVVFILLTQLMINKMDQFVGKDLGVMVLAELMFYFSINITQTALPLAVLLSSLMAFGNLGEFSELTAIKGAGISLLRALRPAFMLTVLITILAFFNNNYIVTKANLKAYSLLYDIRKHKPSLDIKEGTFYNGIPEFSIKVNKKYPDGETLGDIIIYNHAGTKGNNVVTFADSGRMYSVFNNRYLMFELFNGKRYEELPQPGGPRGNISDFIRNDFRHSKLVLSLASFDFKKSKEELWKNHYYMKNISQLKTDVDSMDLDLLDSRMTVFDDAQTFFTRYYRDRIQMPEEYISRQHYHDSLRKATEDADSIKYRAEYVREESERQQADSLLQVKQDTEQTTVANITQIQKQVTLPTTAQPVAPSVVKPVGDIKKKVKPNTGEVNLTELPISEIDVDSILNIKRNRAQGLRHALSDARNIKNKLAVQTNRLRNQDLMITKYKIEVNKKYAQAFACLVMFLIGAPLGAIIKKGGLGVPVIISIIFFILYYVMSITGKKWAEEGVVTPFLGIWGYSFFLLPVGFFFLKQAKNDARLLESDFYSVAVDKLRNRFFKSRNQSKQ
jgi:lipopolysaccharide export system permease protein